MGEPTRTMMLHGIMALLVSLALLISSANTLQSHPDAIVPESPAAAELVTANDDDKAVLRHFRAAVDELEFLDAVGAFQSSGSTVGAPPSLVQTAVRGRKER